MRRGARWWDKGYWGAQPLRNPLPFLPPYYPHAFEGGYADAPLLLLLLLSSCLVEVRFGRCPFAIRNACCASNSLLLSPPSVAALVVLCLGEGKWRWLWVFPVRVFLSDMASVICSCAFLREMAAALPISGEFARFFWIVDVAARVKGQVCLISWASLMSEGARGGEDGLSSPPWRAMRVFVSYD